MLQMGRPLDNLRTIIEEGVTQYGMQSFDQSLMKLLQDQVITEDEALKYCTNPNEFQLHLKGINSSSDRTWAPVDAGQLKNATHASSYGAPAGGVDPSSGARPLGDTTKSSGGLPSWMTKN
jgi:hypothetical protein